MAALIGALRVSLSADTAQFERGMKRAQKVTEQSANGITRVLARAKTSLVGFATAFTAGMLIRAGKEALDYAGSLGEMADTLGVTTKDLQTFRFAAGQVGIAQEELESGIQKLTISMGKAQLGSKAQVKAFEAIGISVDDLKDKNAGDVFRLMAEKLEKVSDRSKRAAVEVALFGKAGAKLDNLLSGSQGRLNELSDAAEKLGIVLSDDQIQNADRTADKIEALWTVLKAQIASDVANNADAILEFASTLETLAKAAIDAGNKVHAFFAGLSDPKNSIANRFFKSLGADINGNFFNPQASVTTKLPPAKRIAGKSGGGDVGQFLASGGGTKARRATREDHTAQDALNDAHQFDQQIRSAQMDVLRAQQDLAGNYVERTTIGIEILNAEKEAREAEYQYQIALFKLTKGKQGQSEAQVAQLRAQEDIVDSLQRQKILDDEQLQRAEDVQALTQGDFDRRKDALQAQLQIAETADERRKIELELLQIAYDQKRQALQNIIDTSKDVAAIENARRDLINLKSTFGSDRQAVINNTRGPMEDFLVSLPTTAAKANEALQALEVEGFNGLIDSVLALSEGVGSATDALLGTLKSFLLGLAKIELQKLLGSALGSGGVLSGLGFASGGFTGNISPHRFAGFVHGSEGVLNAPAMRRLGVPALNALNRGAPLSAVVGNDNGSGMGGRSNVTMYVTTPDADSFRRSGGQTTRALRRQLA